MSEINYSRIPHIYHDTIYSFKIFEIIQEKQNRIRDMWKEIESLNSLDNCTGLTLTMKAGNYAIDRLGDDDDTLRERIKFELKALGFSGHPDEYKEFLSFYYKISKDEIKVRELTGKVMIQIPERLNKNDVYKHLKKIKPAGVGLNVDYEQYVADHRLEELEVEALTTVEKMRLERT